MDMETLIAGLVGVLLGGLGAGGVALLILQRAADRDLVERRLRALISYRETLGAPQRLQGGWVGSMEPAELDQLVHNMHQVSREFRLTSWIFDEKLRLELGRALWAFEEEVHRAQGRGESPSAVRINEAYRHLDITIRRAAKSSVRQFRRWRAWPSRGRENTRPDSTADLDEHTAREMPRRVD